ncbi:MAG: hypothetical protein CVT88_08790 [Candidatus Altiarchaeales archaeon HGW-Altiarchaeales-1]|nr:MAG: hypothetical protein CVT88_08790 [Candidatus Altiarchaeales archaeon HGW-Altiarchaeales-1]PKP58435.1 MAG: hypothetical protein CVT89_02820 [Candidatus Altiarchaeales archaeon HGW-Altiarchaeales-2]
MLMNISKFLEGGVMRTREEARHIQKMTEEVLQKTNDNNVLFDFSGVTFISRSFADEFRVVKLKLEGKGITVELANVCDDVRKMSEIVERAAKKPKLKIDSNYLNKEYNVEVIEI